jgi:hypothetical protein
MREILTFDVDRVNSGSISLTYAPKNEVTFALGYVALVEKNPIYLFKGYDDKRDMPGANLLQRMITAFGFEPISIENISNGLLSLTAPLPPAIKFRLRLYTPDWAAGLELLQRNEFKIEIRLEGSGKSATLITAEEKGWRSITTVANIIVSNYFLPYK